MALPGTKAVTPTTTHAVVQVVESYIQNQNLLGEIAELDDMLCDLVDMHKNNVSALKRVVQCIFNLLQSNSRWNVKFGQKLFHKLISVAIADSRDDSGPRRQLVANVLMCVHLHGQKFRSMDGKFLLYQLWSLSQSSEEQPHAAQILVHLFDDFVQEFGLECYGQLVIIIQNLLQSAEIEKRKSAYFLMTKLLGIIEKERQNNSGLDKKILEILECGELEWSAYVTIMENLEEHQSHLVLPSVVSLMPRLHAGPFSKENWLVCLRILYAKLLANNNILVLRWTLLYFLIYFDLNDVVRLDLLDEFLQATNRTKLYNVEGDKSLIEFQMDSFLTDNSLDLLLDGLAKVPWHSVPLVYWLRQINPEKVPLIPKTLLLEISSRVRALQNPELRQLACKRVIHLFKIILDGLSLSDYMMFIETLYNPGDSYNDYERLINKMKNCDNMANDIVRFNQRCYEIIDPNSNVFIEFIRQTENIPPCQLGWWRLAGVFKEEMCSLNVHDNPLIQDFYWNNYNLDISSLNSFTDLKSLQLHLLEKLNCESKEEKSFILKRGVDYFTERVAKWKLIANPLDLLEQGTERTHYHLVKLLVEQNKKLENDNVLAALIAKLSAKSASAFVAHKFLEYARKFMTSLEFGAFVSDLIDNGIEINSNVSKTMTIKGLLHGETTTGNARIEAAYVHAINNNCYSDVRRRDMKFHYYYYNFKNEHNDIFDDLLHMNNELSRKKQRYFENSKEHRLKIRIAKTLLALNQNTKVPWSNNLWEALLETSNQVNISYMYECLVGYLLPSDDILFERLRTLSGLKPSQQVSLISVVHIYFMLHTENLSNRMEDIITVLLPHTMGPHFQTRLLAQLVLHKLASKRTELPLANAVIESIKVILGEKFDELQSEPRLMLSDIMLDVEPNNKILHITNTPFDEYFCYSTANDKIEMARAAFIAKRKGPNSEFRSLTSTTNGNVQRKMNPYSDIYPKDDLSITSEPTSDYELIVVASLIDKLPNLGGLARTCEVFGVHTLIMATKSDVDKSDFTNISMTAEKSLNIEEVKPLALGEFLIGKQMAGYKIVGAEQTAHSTSFADFRFPKKCVLLLGHEKHGIPIDLIGFLDHAVEIPQFGMVRSLNVHVTGSLFIWEFCKQQVVKK